MIKYIGQHIVDFIARFRSDVYLEDIADGTVADNKFLGLDSNNKIVKEAASATVTDLHSAGVDGSANQLLTDDGDGTITSESELTYNASVLQVESSTSERPSVRLVNSNTDANGPDISFQKTATGASSDVIGTINYIADNTADEVITYATTQGSIASESNSATDTDEAGKYEIKVACSDGSTSALQNAFSAAGGFPVSLQEEVNVDIAYGEFSQTNIAGSLRIGGAQTSGDTFGISANSPTQIGQGGATFTVKGSNAYGTNANGGILALYGGGSTGSGEGGRIMLYGTPPGSSGSSNNTAQSRFTFYVGNETPYLAIGPQSLGVRSMIDFDSETFENSIDPGDSMHSTIIRYAPAGTQSSLSAGQIYFLQTDGSWAQADASATSTGATQLIGVISVGGAVPSKGVVLEGFVRIPSTEILNTPGSGAVDGLPVYVSTTAGHFDFTAPSGNNEYVRCVGYAIDDHSSDVLVYFKPDNTFVKITA
tara:strand:+ start:15 stop:1460 length:1446 start_codon:yes stop_codon:yes gene_type:complete